MQRWHRNIQKTFLRVHLELRAPALLMTCLVMSALPLRAQLTRGVLSGIVMDPSGARIRGASVELSDEATGWQRLER